MKLCTKCGKEKELDDFYRKGKVAHTWCKACAKDYQAHSNRLRLYGLDETRYYEMLAEQGGRCAVCRQAFGDSPRVDHCHSTGLVRGLLCHNCNVGLGHFQDDPERLVSAANYVQQYGTL